MAGTYEVSSVQTDLKRKTASVRLKGPGGILDGVSIGPFPFDPPGQQTEDELEALAIAAAKERLIAAVASLS